MKGIFLLLGTNLGDRKQNLRNAKKAIDKEIGQIISSSKIYETEAWGEEEQPKYLNQVIEIKTKKSPFDILHKTLEIETQLGRKRFQKWESRIIDIDILFYHDEFIHTPELTIPHPQIKNRLFTLIPLNDLVGDLHFPGENETVSAVLKKCPDSLVVTEY